MVTLPNEFVAVKYPGYFWNLTDKKLYSLKVSGILKKLAGPYKPNSFNHLNEPAYKVSVNGSRKILTVSYLQNLKSVNSVIPVEQK